MQPNTSSQNLLKLATKTSGTYGRLNPCPLAKFSREECRQQLRFAAAGKKKSARTQPVVPLNLPLSISTGAFLKPVAQKSGWPAARGANTVHLV